MSISPPDIDFDELTKDLVADQTVQEPAREWVTSVWNDPVNLMSYVSFVFQEYFGYSQAESDKLMMQVHAEGRAVVSRGTKEKMEVDTAAMHGYGLWATFSQDV